MFSFLFLWWCPIDLLLCLVRFPFLKISRREQNLKVVIISVTNLMHQIMVVNLIVILLKEKNVSRQKKELEKVVGVIRRTVNLVKKLTNRKSVANNMKRNMLRCLKSIKNIWLQYKHLKRNRLLWTLKLRLLKI